MTEEWPPSEQAVIKKWNENHYSSLVYSREMPVGDSQPPNWHELGSSKLVDLLRYPEPPNRIKIKLQKHIIQTKEGIKFVQTDSGAEVEIDEVRFFVALLKAWPEPTLPVRIFEAKRELDMKSIGQILTYSTHFQEYYDLGQTRPEIVEQGIIYAGNDPMVAEAAQDQGISLYQVENPERE